MTLGTSEPKISPEADSGLECEVRYDRVRGDDVGYVAVPFTLEILFTSANPAEVSFANWFTVVPTWDEDPEAALYDTDFGALGPAAALDFSDGTACTYGRMEWHRNLTPGEVATITGQVFVPGAVDRYHPDGDPRVLVDLQAGFGQVAPTIDGAKFEFSGQSGSLAAGCSHLGHPLFAFTNAAPYCP